MRHKSRPFHQHPDAAEDGGSGFDHLAEETNPAGGRTDQSDEHSHRRGLPGSVRAEQPEHTAAFDSEIQMVDCQNIAGIALGDVFDDDWVVLTAFPWNRSGRDYCCRCGEA